MHTNLQLIRQEPSAATRFAVELHQRTEAARIPTNNCHHQRQSKQAGTRERLRGATNSEPDRQRILHGPRIDALAVQRWPEFAGPGDPLVGAQHQQEVQLLSEQRVVVLEVVAEQRERLDRGAATDDHLRSPFGDQVNGRELLEQAHRVRRAQD